MIVGQSHYSWQEFCIRCECYTYNHKVFITKLREGWQRLMLHSEAESKETKTPHEYMRHPAF